MYFIYLCILYIYVFFIYFLYFLYFYIWYIYIFYMVWNKARVGNGRRQRCNESIGCRGHAISAAIAGRKDMMTVCWKKWICWWFSQPKKKRRFIFMMCKTQGFIIWVFVRFLWLFTTVSWSLCPLFVYVFPCTASAAAAYSRFCFLSFLWAIVTVVSVLLLCLTPQCANGRTRIPALAFGGKKREARRLLRLWVRRLVDLSTTIRRTAFQ